ncbi:MAG: phosphate acyltransferase PlsX [Desulfonauticus sp.]|nr:phosphate acyltransferase PlsX [Desulfonauticus sp.]
MNSPCIAVDAMGGDYGPEVVVPGAIAAARSKNISLVLVGKEKEIASIVAQEGAEDLDIQIHPAEEVVGMDEKPSEVLRKKKNSSIQEAFVLARKGQVDGVVSAGNSGATLACGMFTVGRIKGIERPALASILPTEKNPVILIDVGANVDCKPIHLLQFGLMAEIFAKHVLDITRPRIGLLTIGEEEGKGNSLVKQTFELFKASPSNFVGNVEGRDIFKGNVDVIVCDGFVGNVCLKLMEGLALSLTNLLKKEVKKSFLAQLGFLIARRALKSFGKKIDYAEYGGAPLLGLKKIALVCHGASNSKAIKNAILMAASFIENKANFHLEDGLAKYEELVSFCKTTETSQPKSA